MPPCCSRRSRARCIRAGLKAALDRRCARRRCGSWPGWRNDEGLGRTKECCLGGDGGPCSAPPLKPQRDGTTDHGCDGRRPEIASVERRWRGVQKEELAGPKCTAAAPDRQSATEMIADQRRRSGLIVDADVHARAADACALGGRHALHQRHIPADVTALDHPAGQRRNGPNHDQIADSGTGVRLHGIEADRCAGGRIPEQPGTCLLLACERQNCAGLEAEDEQWARPCHGATAWRSSHA